MTKRMSGNVFARALRAARRTLVLLATGDVRLTETGNQLRRLQRSADQTAARVRATEKASVHVQTKRLSSLRESVDDLRSEMRDWRQQTTLQLQRLQSRSSAEPSRGGQPQAFGGPAIPLTIEGPGPGYRRPADAAAHPDPDGKEWLTLTACPYCGDERSVAVLEWNKLILLEVAPDDDSARYDYVMCSACGVLYASRRPVGRRYQYLLEHFGEVTAKQGGGAAIKNPLLNPYALTTDDEAQLRRMAARGVFVSEHLGLSKREYLEGLVKDRFENSMHVDLLGNLVPVKGARVLELRPRTGAIAESLRRLFGADVSVVPMWESQQLLLKEVYGFESRGLVDYDHFVSPFEGPFNLIVCNHMLTHMLRPADFLRELRSLLTAEGYVYFYNEPEDLEYLDGGQSMIAHFNPLHMHGFDQRALVRMLAANGFEVVFVKGRGASHLCLARLNDHATRSSMSDAERTVRLARLEAARDRAVLKMPAAMRGRVAGSWSGAIGRALEAGDVEFDSKGHLRFVAANRRRRYVETDEE